MSTGPEHVVHVADGTPLATALHNAFTELREARTVHASVVFPVSWKPSVDIVPHIVAHASKVPTLQTLVLVHGSAAMSFIASTIGLHLPNVLVRPSRTVGDAKRRRSAITLTGTVAILAMKTSGETAAAFVHRAGTEMREKGFRDVVLAFAATADIITSTIGDVLLDELIQNNTLRAVALVHPTATNLEVIASSVRLRLPRAKIVTAPDVGAAEHLVLLASG